MDSLITCRIAGALLVVAALPFKIVSAQKETSTALAESMWAAQVDPKSIRVVWNHQDGITGYRVSCAIGTRPEKYFGTISTAGLSEKDASGLPRRKSTIVPIQEPGSEHRCVLKWSTDAKQTLSASLPFNVVTPIVPSTTERPAPSAVTARATALGEITLEWPEVQGATGYMIGRAVFPDGYKTFCDLCPARPKFVDRYVKGGLKHTYIVSAVTPAGLSSRAMSNTVVAPKTHAELVSASDAGVDPALKAPARVSATVSGPASVVVTWRGVENANGYQIFRSVNGGGFQLVARVSAGTVEVEYPDYVGSFLSSGSNQVKVGYAVKSLDANGAATEPTLSNEVVIDSKAGMQPGTTSTNASNLRTVVTSANSLTLTWTPPAAGIECRLSRSLSSGDFAALPPISQGTSQYVDTAPTLLNQRPEYQITCGDAKSLNAPLRFPRPDWDPAGPVATAPESSSATAASNLKAVGTSLESVTLMWGPPTNPIACNIRRSLNGGAYTVITALPIGAWQYVDTMSGLSTMRPRYQIACGDPKTGTVVSFANPVFK